VIRAQRKLIRSGKPANLLLQAEHADKGIRNIENCARCHRSGLSESEGSGRDDVWKTSAKRAHHVIP
jgi:hypothetical protein